jgi:Na+-translocating ferredoxin:NAD+ oxidoreductase RnfC subunit
MTTDVQISPEEAVKKFREAGLMGAGGAGFPTYFKYNTKTKILVVNCEEGEPGYEADKLLLIKEADAFVKIFDYMREAFGFEQIIIGAKEKDQGKLDPLGEQYGFEFGYTPSIYGMGEERWLTKDVTGIEVPPDKIAPQMGVTVNNVETLYNMHQALFADLPVTEKYLNVYGEVAKQSVYRVPVGTYAADLLGHTGLDTSRSHDLTVIDGGPMMGDLVSGTSKRITDEGLQQDDRKLSEASVSKKTNGYLVVDKGLYVADQAAFKHLKGETTPGWEDTLPVIMGKMGLERYLDWSPSVEDLVILDDEIKRVRIAMKQGFGGASIPTVSVGDAVSKGDVIAKPIADDVTDFKSISVYHHASIDGKVTEVADTHVCIER